MMDLHARLADTARRLAGAIAGDAQGTAAWTADDYRRTIEACAERLCRLV